MAFDNLCKHLAETYPDDFAVWLLGEPLPNVEVLKTELGIEPTRADSVTFLRGTNRVLHVEFQTETASSPPLPLRMLDYWIRLHRKYDLPVTQILILLRETATEIPNVFELEKTRHEFEIVKMWEQDAQVLLDNEHLLPLATLAKTDDKNELLENVAKRIKLIENKEFRSDLTARTQIFAALRFETNLIKLLLNDDVMRESQIYQEILQEGRQEGVTQGITQGLHKGQVELLLRMLTKRFGKIDELTNAQIDKFSVAQLEELGVALFDFKEPKDLQNWLDENETAQ